VLGASSSRVPGSPCFLMSACLADRREQRHRRSAGRATGAARSTRRDYGTEIGPASDAIAARPRRGGSSPVLGVAADVTDRDAVSGATRQTRSRLGADRVSRSSRRGSSRRPCALRGAVRYVGRHARTGEDPPRVCLAAMASSRPDLRAVIATRAPRRTSGSTSASPMPLLARSARHADHQETW